MMKSNYSIFLIFFIFVNIQAQFGGAKLISSPSDTSSGKQFIRTADVDSDGKTDILVASSFNNLVRYFHNTGNFTFSLPIILPGSWGNLDAMEVGDLNNDGKPDFVTLDIQTKKLFWHPNIEGNFPQQILISENLIPVSGRILAKDFNGDEKIDLVILNHFNALLFLNEGSGVFSAPKNIVAPEEETEFYDNVAGDFNKDGFVDLAITSSGFSIFLNDGIGNFTKSPDVGFRISFLLESADYNNDGYDDLLMKDSNTLYHYKNTQNGFALGGLFSPNNENYQTLFSSDLDNDGDLDVISEDNQTNSFFWYENVLGGTSWIRHTISSGFNFSTIYGVRAADLDGDGDQDLIRSSSNGDVAIYENQIILASKNHSMSSLSFYPNPASNKVFIKGLKDHFFNFKIYDLTGKLILKSEIQNKKIPIDISGVIPGNYFLKIEADKRIEIKKLIISR